MPPHKNPFSLPVEDQLKLIRESIEETGSDVYGIKVRQRRHDDQLRLIRIESKDTYKMMNKLYKSMEKWKSDIFTKLDTSFAKPVRDLQQESAAQAIQIQRINKLVFPPQP